MRKFIFCFSLLLFYSGCKDTATEPTTNEQFYPLQIGNYWNYRLLKYDSLGNLTDNSIVLPERILRDTVINGEKWFLLNVMGYLSMVDIPYINKSNGLHTWSGRNAEIVYKYPANIGDVCGDSLKIVGINQRTTTIAGDFTCVVYKKEKYDPTLFWIYYNTFIAPGYGKVKVEYFQSIDRVKWYKIGEYNLDNFKLN